MKQFTGFPEDFADFLIKLSFSNTIENQKENLIKYKAVITEPLNKLYCDLLPVACEIHSCFDTKPSRCISTPYTDRRFSPNTPLKKYMYLRFRQGGKTKDITGLYFDMGADYYSFGLRIYKQTACGFQAIKDKVTESPEKFMKVLKDLKTNGFEIIGGQYKKDHYPEISNEIIKDLLNRKTFYISKEKAINNTVFSSELADELAQGFYQLKEFANLII